MAETNPTIDFINGKALVVTTIFGLFGNALIKVLDIPELKVKYMGLAYLLSLVVILLINFWLKTRRTRKVKLALKIISVILFAGLLWTLYSFIKTVDDVTFKYKDYNDSSGTYVKGGVKGLQPAAAFLVTQSEKKHGETPSDQKLVDMFGGINHINEVWKEDFITANGRKLLISYMIMAVLFVAIIYYLTELLITKTKPKPKPPAA